MGKKHDATGSVADFWWVLRVSNHTVLGCFDLVTRCFSKRDCSAKLFCFAMSTSEDYAGAATCVWCRLFAPERTEKLCEEKKEKSFKHQSFTTFGFHHLHSLVFVVVVVVVVVQSLKRWKAPGFTVTLRLGTQWRPAQTELRSAGQAEQWSSGLLSCWVGGWVDDHWELIDFMRRLLTRGCMNEHMI